jgi:hypothetical protein
VCQGAIMEAAIMARNGGPSSSHHIPLMIASGRSP